MDTPASLSDCTGEAEKICGQFTGVELTSSKIYLFWDDEFEIISLEHKYYTWPDAYDKKLNNLFSIVFFFFFFSMLGVECPAKKL